MCTAIAWASAWVGDIVAVVDDAGVLPVNGCARVWVHSHALCFVWMWLYSGHPV